MCIRQCAMCGASLDENFYLCRDCYQNEPLKYMRFLVYNIDEDFSRVYDYVSNDTTFNILEHISGSFVVLAKDTLPYFMPEDIELLPLKEFEENKPVQRAYAKGYPKAYLLSKYNEFSTVYIELNGKHYISKTSYSNFDTENILKDCFLKPEPRYCLECDAPTKSDEYYICPRCYYDFASHDFDLYYKYDMKNNIFTRLCAEFQGRYTCVDGHRVKSRGEEFLDNYFFANDIKHSYEPKLKFENDIGEMVEITPDFCIYKGDELIYLEYWGVTNNAEYERNKKLKMSAYKKLGVTLINIYSTGPLLNEEFIEELLSTYKKGQINFEE
ncbi:MAG: hypothetical protein IJ400_02685 [Clostridia bacterium]|nr:hypothetical protein [Clostridia bacterium]